MEREEPAMKTKNKLITYDDFMGKQLQDPKFLETYLNEKLESGDTEQFLLALRNIAKSEEGGFSTFAKKTGIKREALYRTLSANGNPRFGSLKSILNAAGFQLKVESVQKAPATKKTTKAKRKPRRTLASV